MMPDPDGVLQRLQARGELLPFRMAEIAGAATEGQHEKVVVQGVVGQQHAPSGQIDSHDAFEQYRHVLFVRHDAADRLRDFGRGKPRRRDLIKQGLEQMVIGSIDQRHASSGVIELLAKRQPAESRAQHHDVGSCWLRHTRSLN